MIFIPARVAERAFNRWVEDENGCYISTYSVASHGYAQIGWWVSETNCTKGTTAHRAAWVHVNGQIEGRFDVDHRPTCDRRCVNVSHLRLLTPEDNRRRQSGTWPLGQCRKGHSDEYREPTKKGSRCAICHRESTVYVPRERKKRTHCKSGHPFDHVIYRPDGSVQQQRCSICVARYNKTGKENARKKRAVLA